MATFGKVLLFFNLLLAAVFVYLVSVDYGKEQSWAYSAFRHWLVINGLPVDNDELDPYYPDEKVVDQLNTPTITDVFAGNQGGTQLGGPPVKTVKEELQRVRAKVKTNIDGAASDSDRADLLWVYLVRQARTLDQRQDWQKRIIDYKKLVVETIPQHEKQNAPDVAELKAKATKDLDDLKKDLDKQFAEAESANRSEKSANRREIRLNAAHVLINLSGTNDLEWSKRVMTIVGMDAYQEALNRHADDLAQMSQSVVVALKNDEAHFLNQYASLSKDIELHAEELFLLDMYLTELKAYLAQRQQQLQQRMTEVATQTKNLHDMTSATHKELAHLDAIQKDIFALQLRLGMTIQKNQELEADIRKMEIKK